MLRGQVARLLESGQRKLELLGHQTPLCLPIDSAQEPSQVRSKCNDCHSE
jgi:hypothetical protein